MIGDDFISYKDLRDAKIERDVLEKLFFERTYMCDEDARIYYNDKKRRALESMAPVEGEDEKQKKFRLKKANKELLKLCTQFGHDAPCPTTEDELVECRCCGEKFNYATLIDTYYRKTKFARMILFDYIKAQPIFQKTNMSFPAYDADEESNED